MRAFFSLFLCGILILTASCSHSADDIPVIDFEHPKASTNLKLSDIMSDIIIVPLESRADILLSAGQNIAITDQYIIVADQNAIYQFDKTGKYIKQLAIRGNGPNEFLRIRSLLPDEQNGILYYQDIRDNKALLSLDMNSGAFLKTHLINVYEFSINIIDEQGMIYGFTNPNPMRPLPTVDSLTIAYQYNLKEEIITRFERDREFSPRHAFGNSMCYYDRELFFTTIYSDTLFKIENSLPSPYAYLKFDDRKIDFNSNGNYVRVILKYKDGMILQKCYNETSVMGRGWIETNQPVNYYLVDNSGNINSINSLLIDPLAISVPIIADKNNIFPINTFPLPTIKGEWGYIIMDAVSMINWIQNSLSRDQLSPEQRQYLEEIAVSLTEDSNPVLIIGKFKRNDLK